MDDSRTTCRSLIAFLLSKVDRLVLYSASSRYPPLISVRNIQRYPYLRLSYEIGTYIPLTFDTTRKVSCNLQHDLIVIYGIPLSNFVTQITEKKPHSIYLSLVNTSPFIIVFRYLPVSEDQLLHNNMFCKITKFDV